MLISVMKDEILPEFKSDVIHRTPCVGCEGCYIGQTSQWLKQRVTQHKSDCRLGTNSCVLVEHHLRLGHNFDYHNIDCKNRVQIQQPFIPGNV